VPEVHCGRIAGENEVISTLDIGPGRIRMADDTGVITWRLEEAS
jgi:hypothetical protein